MTEAFRKDTNTDPGSTEGRTYWPCILSLRLLLISRENDKNFRLGPNPTVKVYNNRDLTEEANQDKRLIQKTELLVAPTHPPP